jgi:hypothetical protein
MSDPGFLALADFDATQDAINLPDTSSASNLAWSEEVNLHKTTD